MHCCLLGNGSLGSGGILGIVNLVYLAAPLAIFFGDLVKPYVDAF